MRAKSVVAGAAGLAIGCVRPTAPWRTSSGHRAQTPLRIGRHGVVRGAAVHTPQRLSRPQVGTCTDARTALLSRKEARRGRLAALEAARRGDGNESCALCAKLGEAITATEAEREELRDSWASAEAPRRAKWRENVAALMQRSGGKLYKTPASVAWNRSRWGATSTQFCPYISWTPSWGSRPGAKSTGYRPSIAWGWANLGPIVADFDKFGVFRGQAER